jgi:hypothetical protein
VRAIGGDIMYSVCAGDAAVPSGYRRTLHGLGMPIRGTAVGQTAYTCARGDLHVHLRLRSLRESSLRFAGAIAAALAGGAALPWLVHKLVARPRRRRKVAVMSMWAGPGPGISAPFRVWGKPGLYKYKMEYVDCA